MHNREGLFKGFDGLDLYYQVWEPAGVTKAALILVHGIGEHSNRYPKLVNGVVTEGYAIYAPELRGHGRSAGQHGHINSWDEYRQALHIFVQKVVEMTTNESSGSPIFILGHSLGGLIVLDYILHYPDYLRGVIASAPALEIDVPPILAFISRIMSILAPRVSLKTPLDTNAISRRQEVVEAYIKDPMVHGVASARFGTEYMATMAWVNAHAADIHLPLLIIHGSADRIIPARSSKVFFEKVSSVNKQRIEYEGGYHESHNDLHADQAVKDIVDWLDSHLPAIP
jgi:alpha-beta hydrolase superfamily lysophospholipase